MDSWVISQISFWYTVHEVRPSEADALPLHTVSFTESIEHVGTVGVSCGLENPERETLSLQLG
jgi:hypothetical protein